jgi:hypothetical protein
VRHFPSLIALLPIVAAACASSDDRLAVGVSPSLVFPTGLLDTVTKLTLVVYDASPAVSCDAATGRIVLGGKADPFLTKDLEKCTSGRGKFCGQLQIAKNDNDRVFGAVARAGSTEVADGCAVAKVNQDELPLEIKMIRHVPPAVCGNGSLEPTEQCEPAGGAGDPLCDDQCHTKEMLLSVGGNGTTNPSPGQKSKPFFLWPSGTGNAGRFFAFYSDANQGSPEVAMRVMSDELKPLDSPTALKTSLFLPADPGIFPPQATTGDQAAPAAASIGSKYYVVFEDNNSPGSNGLDIHLRSMDQALVPDQNIGQPYIGINGPGGGGEANIQEAPALAAGPGNLLFIAWQDRSAGKIRGRTFNPSGNVLGTQQEIGDGARVQLAATTNGWVAVWESQTDVKLRALGADGTPSGAEQTVNENTNGTQNHPSVASLPDGRFAVVFASNGDIFLQRYAANGSKVAGDQAAPINDLVKGSASAPVIASMPSGGGAFAIAWLDGVSGHVRARLAGGASGFLFNNVDGQPTEFQASLTDGRQRDNPAIAVGGAGQFLAIGWEDKSPNPGSGIIARRFPVPQ